MEKIGIIIAFVLLLAAPVFASISDTCLDNITLQRNINYTFETDVNVKNLTITKNEDCQYGCDNVTNTCAPDPVSMNLWFGGGMLALLFIIGLIIRQWRGG